MDIPSGGKEQIKTIFVPRGEKAKLLSHYMIIITRLKKVA